MDVFSGNNIASSINSSKNNFNFQNNMINTNFNKENIPKNLKITAWVLFFISIIFSVLLI